MRDSDWSRPNLLRSDWLGPFVAICTTDLVNILWVVALLKACDVTNNGCHLVFYQELEMRLKSREIVVFVLYIKITPK